MVLSRSANLNLNISSPLPGALPAGGLTLFSAHRMLGALTGLVLNSFLLFPSNLATPWLPLPFFLSPPMPAQTWKLYPSQGAHTFDPGTHESEARQELKASLVYVMSSR